MQIHPREEGRSRRWRRRLMRDCMTRRFNSPLDPVSPPAGGGTPASPPPPPVAATSPPPSQPATPSPSSAAGPGTSGLPTPGATPVSAAPAQGQPVNPASVAQPSFDQQFRQRYGMDPSQAQMLMTMGYQQYQGGQPRPGQPAQGSPAPAAPAQENIFGLPQFDYRLLDFVQKGPDGGLVLLPGAPPDAGIRVQAFQDQLRKVQQGFFENPMQYLEKPIQQLVEKRAAEMYQQQFGQHQSQTAAQQIIAENDSWLYARDASGQKQFTFDPSTGRNVPALSQWGQFYQTCIRDVAGAGVQDPQQQHRLALSMVETAALRAKANATVAAPPGTNPAATQFLNSVAHPGQPAAPAAAATPAPAQPNVPFSMRDRMEREFQANGITDQVLQQQLARHGA